MFNQLSYRSPLFSQFSVTVARAGEGLMAELQVEQALGCSSSFGLGSAVPGPRFLGTQPSCAT